MIYKLPIAKEPDMVIVKKSATKTALQIPSVGNTTIMSSCLTKSQHETPRTLTKRQQLALFNFLYGRQSHPGLKNNVTEQIVANSISFPCNQPKEY